MVKIKRVIVIGAAASLASKLIPHLHERWPSAESLGLTGSPLKGFGFASCKARWSSGSIFQRLGRRNPPLGQRRLRRIVGGTCRTQRRCGSSWLFCHGTRGWPL